MQIRNVYGIDLGTSTVKIYDLKKDTITKEKNMIAIRNREQVIAVGNYAYEMHERTPSNIEVITPMSNGRIANVLMVEAVCTRFSTAVRATWDTARSCIFQFPAI